MALMRGSSLKQVARVTVSFCPFDRNTSTVRDFLLRVSCRRMIDSNPKCQVISNFKNDGSEPLVEVVFRDMQMRRMVFSMDRHVIAESWTSSTQKKTVCVLTLCESTGKLTTDSVEPEWELLVVVDHSIGTSGQTIGLLFINT